MHRVEIKARKLVGYLLAAGRQEDAFQVRVGTEWKMREKARPFFPLRDPPPGKRASLRVQQREEKTAHNCDDSYPAVLLVCGLCHGAARS